MSLHYMHYHDKEQIKKFRSIYLLIIVLCLNKLSHDDTHEGFPIGLIERAFTCSFQYRGILHMLLKCFLHSSIALKIKQENEKQLTQRKYTKNLNIKLISKNAKILPRIRLYWILIETTVVQRRKVLKTVVEGDLVAYHLWKILYH